MEAAMEAEAEAEAVGATKRILDNIKTSFN